MTSYPSPRVGYYWSDKKSLKLDASYFKTLCHSYGFELIKLNFDRPFEEQGPFVAIVHKPFDFMLQAENGDSKSAALLEAFQLYLDQHPEIIVIDPLTKIRKLTDRYTQYACVVNELSKKGGFIIPAFVELTKNDVAENLSKLKSARLDFPILCKPSLAHSSPSHKMCIIFNEEGIKDISPPCVAQKFINHNAVLYKLFTIGNKYFLIERPSLKNFKAGDQKTIYFNSHDVSKPHSASTLNELDDDEEKTPLVYPEKEKTDYIVKVLYNCLGLNLLGIDFIIDNKTGQYAVVDINYFPGYIEIDDFFTHLCDLIVDKISLKSSGNSQLGLHSKQLILPHSVNHQKFNFSSTCLKGSKPVAPTIPRCLCCPISSTCLNGIHSEPKKPKPVLHMSESHSHSVDCLQEDSGIETSDSCDEKKEPCHRTMRRLHSRSLYADL